MAEEINPDESGSMENLLKMKPKSILKNADSDQPKNPPVITKNSYMAKWMRLKHFVGGVWQGMFASKHDEERIPESSSVMLRELNGGAIDKPKRTVRFEEAEPETYLVPSKAEYERGAVVFNEAKERVEAKECEKPLSEEELRNLSGYLDNEMQVHPKSLIAPNG